MKKGILLLLVWTCCFTLSARQVKVACVGNSVTFGQGISDREQDSYPAQLQRMLGSGYEVRNFGKSGATLLAHGHRPYIEQQEYLDALAFSADVVVIHLGLNDSDPRNWGEYQQDFVRDYLRLIQSFQKANPACEIWICRMSPTFPGFFRYVYTVRYWEDSIQQAIEEVAACAQVGLIDLHKELYARPDLFADFIHPNAEGAGIIARTICTTLTGDWGGLQMPEIYSDNMVLQRNKILCISGKANAGELIEVNIDKQKQKVTAGTDGQWNVQLAPMDAGGPFQLIVKSKKRTLTYTDVLIGEVWLCSGQSNMEFPLKSAATGKEALSDCRNSQIRLFKKQARWPTARYEWPETALDSVNRLAYLTEGHWTLCDVHNAADFSAVAYFFGKMLADSLKVPIGLIDNSVGGSCEEAWIDRYTLEHEYTDILLDWKRNGLIHDVCRDRAALNTKKATNPLQRHPFEPCYLYEAGIAPLASYPIKGVIWYQGEANAHKTEVHNILFPLLVKSWRQTWKDDLPFYYVQLSGYSLFNWVNFRDAGRKLMNTIPGTGMAVSHDMGDSTNIHPVRKQAVGERLARWALNKSYGFTSVVPSGPLYRSVEFKDRAAFLSFDYAEGLCSSDRKPLRTFEIAEFDGCFVPATAEILEDGQIKVYNDEIKNPRYVRYAWTPCPLDANLVNGAGLPASTFKTGGAW